MTNVTRHVVQLSAWLAVLLVLGNIVTYQSEARESAACMLAPQMCGQCHDCGHGNGHGHGYDLLDHYSSVGYQFPVSYPFSTVVMPPTYSFSYYQNPLNYGGYDGRTTIFSNTAISNGPVFYSRKHADRIVREEHIDAQTTKNGIWLQRPRGKRVTPEEEFREIQKHWNDVDEFDRNWKV